MQRNADTHGLLMGIWNGTDTLEESLAISYNTKQTLFIQSSNHAPRYLPKESENLYSSKPAHRCLQHLYFIYLYHNCQNWEAIKIPLRNWVSKPTLVHPSIHPKEHYSALKSNEWSSHEEDMEETRMHTARVHAKSLQSCLTLCDPMGYSPPGSSVHGILQARILEWVVMPSSRGSS